MRPTQVELVNIDLECGVIRRIRVKDTGVGPMKDDIDRAISLLYPKVVYEPKIKSWWQKLVDKFRTGERSLIEMLDELDIHT